REGVGRAAGWAGEPSGEEHGAGHDRHIEAGGGAIEDDLPEDPDHERESEEAPGGHPAVRSFHGRGTAFVARLWRNRSGGTAEGPATSAGCRGASIRAPGDHGGRSMGANRTSLILASLLILSIVALVGCASGGAARLSTVGNPVPPGDAEAY